MFQEDLTTKDYSLLCYWYPPTTPEMISEFNSKKINWKETWRNIYNKKRGEGLLSDIVYAI